VPIHPIFPTWHYDNGEKSAATGGKGWHPKQKSHQRKIIVASNLYGLQRWWNKWVQQRATTLFPYIWNFVIYVSFKCDEYFMAIVYIALSVTEIIYHRMIECLANNEFERPWKDASRERSPRHQLNRRLGVPQSLPRWYGENSWPYRNFNSGPSVGQPVASLHTDYRIII
jgi:hypothetical protein